jgi:hypothetical protein
MLSALPNQFFLVDGNEQLSMCCISQLNMEFIFRDALVLDFNNIFQQQAKLAYFAIGGALGRDVFQLMA